MSKPSVVPDMSGSASSPLENGPETPYVVAAIDALLRADVVGARLALIDGAEVTSWQALAHRLDVAGHALAVDAGLDVSGSDDVVLLPGLDTSSWAEHHDDSAVALIARWTRGDHAGGIPLDHVWPSLSLVAWLVDRAGYPAEVIV